MKKKTIEQWRDIIDRRKQFEGTTLEFCKSIGISDKTFYNARKRVLDQDLKIIPVIPYENEMIKLQVNGFLIEFDSSISDVHLSKIFRACAGL